MSPSHEESLDQHLSSVAGFLERCQLLTHDSVAVETRRHLADRILEHLPSSVEQWLVVVVPAFEMHSADRPQIRGWITEAMERWAAHIQDPSNIETYVMLRMHARRGFIAEFSSSRFLAGQMKIYQILRNALRNDPTLEGQERQTLLDLFEQEFNERILHTTDFFVEGKVLDLHEHELSYQQSINEAPALILTIDFDDGVVLEANRMALRVTGYEPEDIVGQPIWNLHPPRERPQVKKHWQATRLGNKTPIDDLHLLSRDGTEVPVFVNSGVVELRRRRYIHQICVDRTERRKLERQLIQSEKLAALGQLAAGVAHEIRNPLGAIRNALFNLKESLPSDCEEGVEDIQIAEEELVRAKEIIENLLEFSRPSHRESEPIDLNQLLDRTLGLMRKSLEAASIEVDARLGDVPACIANENAMRQVVLNLITNAIQAMPDGGKLLLGTVLHPTDNGHGPRLELTVGDSGTGIAPEHIGDIFNPFFTTKAPGQGTGLGLAVVHSIIRQIQGEIHVESVLGSGTTFRLELPCDCIEVSEAPQHDVG